MRAHVIGFAAASVLCMASAQGAAVTGQGYTAVFPCQTKTDSQTIKAGSMPIPVVSYFCEKDGAIFYLVVSSYPKGFIAKKPLDDSFYDAVAGAATNVRGTIRSDKPMTLGKVAGHDALIDVKKDKAAAHLRVFFVGDKQYQVLVAGPAGNENSKATLAFLDSFKLK